MNNIGQQLFLLSYFEYHISVIQQQTNAEEQIGKFITHLIYQVQRVPFKTQPKKFQDCMKFIRNLHLKLN